MLRRRPSQPALLRKFQVFAFRAALTHRVILMPATPIAARRDYARRECAFLAAAGQTPAPGANLGLWRLEARCYLIQKRLSAIPAQVLPLTF